MGKKKRTTSSRRAHSKSSKSSSKQQQKASSVASTGSSETIRGLSNLGNTCFFNASLQALVAVLEEDIILSTSNSTSTSNTLAYSENLKIYSNFYEILKILSGRGGGSGKIVSPSQLLNSLTTKVHQFNNRRQHDSHELILHLLSSVFEEFEKAEITSHPLQLLWNGNLTGIVCCQNCQYRSCSINKFVDISLEIPGSRHLFRYPARSAVVLPTRVTRSKKKQTEQIAPLDEKNANEKDITTVDESNHLTDTKAVAQSPELESSDNGEQSPALEDPQQHDSEETRHETSLEIIEPLDDGVSASTNPSSISLFDCLRQYTSREMLTVESGEGYLCPKCSEVTSEKSIAIHKRAATKRLLILDQPTLLLIHLKRLLPGGKCMSFISFPLKLSLESFVGIRATPTPLSPENNPSPLYNLRAVIVHQGSGSGGHYIAYVYRSNQWYFTSDAATRKAPESEVLQSQAYILMYRLWKPQQEEDDKVLSDVENQLTALNLHDSSNPSGIMEDGGERDVVEEKKEEFDEEEGDEPEDTDSGGEGEEGEETT